MKTKKKYIVALALCLAQPLSLLAQSDEKRLFFISNSHLDSQWNWTARTTIDEYILKTMSQNFSLFAKYPAFHFNFEGSIKYRWMKEYYPTEYARLKKYIESGRWTISGGSVDANDVMIPSAESIIRNFLYGQIYYKKEFGRKGGTDIMLPDCFGFPYSLPTLGKHCGITGFHTQKLSWGSAYNYDQLAPFGIWKGVDGSEIYAIFKGEAYDQHEKFNKDMSTDSDMSGVIEDNYRKYGVAAAFRYVGPRGDRGGGLQDNASSSEENTPFWLQQSVTSDGPVKVSLSTPDEIFRYMDENRNDKYWVWDNELPMTKHGTGCYTSQTIMKYWNRKNELLADATEKASVAADWMGGLAYPSDFLAEAWTRLLWHQFHDDLTGTSIPGAYDISYNDEVLVNLDLAKTLTNSVGAVIRKMDTQVEGIPIVIYNPLSIQRTDIVEASVNTGSRLSDIRVLNENGQDVPSQITHYDSNTGKLTFIFKATVSSLGFTAYELRLNESSTIESSLKVTANTLENELFKVTVDKNGDVRQIKDKQRGEDLLLTPIRLALFSDKSDSFPSWEIMYDDVSRSPIGHVDENVKVSVAENGPLRIALKIFRTKNGSEYVQYVRMTDSSISNRIDFVNEVDWQSRNTMLKAVFPLTISNPRATYDLSIGAIERGSNTEELYEVAAHQWADLTNVKGTYGVSILNDCKYGWDKPDSRTLRLTLIHTPEVGGGGYVYQKNQDLGLNKFTYSIYPHPDKLTEATQWEASKLNQPMLAFQAPKHTGKAGKTVEFASLNTDKVAIKALKKAEESDELIVRVYELTGNEQNDVQISFPSEIVSAREVNGIEEEVGPANYTAKALTFALGKYQPKTFAVKLASPDTDIITAHPSSVPVNLDYNFDAFSTDVRRNNVTGGAYAYPTELVPGTIISDGIEFTMGSGEDGVKNAVSCKGQTIKLPVLSGLKKIYILAASADKEGTKVEFKVDKNAYSYQIPYYAGNMGIWETQYSLGSAFRRENVAFTATHCHNVKSRTNELYGFMYMYKYAISVPEGASELVLPYDENLYVFAISLSDNENDDITPASAITSLPEFEDIVEGRGCGEQLIPVSVTASHQNGDNESAMKATDGDLNTKWCVTNNNTPYLELTFAESVDICHWFVMNAGIESTDYITNAFRLQRYENGKWIDVDIVNENTDNKVHRYVEPFKTDRVRLQIDKGELKGNATRILEFAVYGKLYLDPDGIIASEKDEASGLYIKGNYPNPFGLETTIQCMVPEGVTQLTLYVYDQSGKLVDKQLYSVANGGLQELEWKSRSVNDGIYLYRLSASKGDGSKDLFSNTKKIVVSKERN